MDYEKMCRYLADFAYWLEKEAGGTNGAHRFELLYNSRKIYEALGLLKELAKHEYISQFEKSSVYAG